MANISRAAFQQYSLTTKEELRKFPGFFNYYESEEDNTDTKIYLGSYIGTGTAVSGGSAAVATGLAPTLARKFSTNSIFAFGSPQNQPLALLDTQWPAITATGAGSGWTFPVNGWSVGTSDFIRVVLKSSAPTNVTVVIGSSATDTVTFNFTGVNSTWAPFTAQIASGTVAGSPVYTNLNSIRITSSVAAVVECYVVYFDATQNAFIGTANSLKLDCLNEFNVETNKDTGEIMCFNYVERVVPTKFGMTVKFSTQNLNSKVEAATSGEAITRGPSNLITVINSENEGGKFAITSNVITLSTGLDWTRFASVTIGDILLNVSAVATDLSETTCVYNSTTGTLTFATGIYNTKVPTVYYTQSATGNYFEYRNLKTGAVGNFIIQRQSADGRTEVMEFYKAMLTKYDRKQGDTNVAVEGEIQILPITRGSDRVFGRVTTY